MDPRKYATEEAQGRSMFTRDQATGDWKHEAIPGMEVCDFCASTPVVRRYRAASAEMFSLRTPEGTLHHASEGEWGACETCAALVDANDRRALLDRAVDVFFAGGTPEARQIKAHPRGPALLRESFRASHETFFRTRLD